MKSKAAEKSDLICVAEIVGSHGIKGMLKLKVYSENPDDLIDYMPLCSSDEKKEFTFKNIQPHKNIFLATLNEIKDRTQADNLRGTKLYIHRDKLPEIDNRHNFYHADLIDLNAVSPEGEDLGKVIDVRNYGAGDLLEISPLNGKSYYIPFNNNCVPEVNLEKKEVIIIKPTEV